MRATKASVQKFFQIAERGLCELRLGKKSRNSECDHQPVRAHFQETFTIRMRLNKKTIVTGDSEIGQLLRELLFMKALNRSVWCRKLTLAAKEIGASCMPVEASDDLVWRTGTILTIDGGYSAQ